MRLKIKKEASIGEVLTSISILISLAGVMIHWHQDRQIEIRKQSRQIKELSIQAFSNVINLRDLNLYFYNRAEIIIKEASQSFATDKDNIKTRDIFSKGITQLRNEIDYEIMRKDLKTFHFILLSNGLDHDSTFLKAITLINLRLEQNHSEYMRETQSVILAEEISYAKQTAILANSLREVNEKYRTITREIFKQESATLQDYLHSVMIKTDKETVYPERN